MLGAATLAATLLVLVWSGSAHSASTVPITVPTGFRDSEVANVPNPTAMAVAPDGRLFVAQKANNNVGRLQVIKNGQLLSKPFLKLTTDTSYFRGLLGVTFDPNFSQNKYVYVFYTATNPTVHNRVSRFTANGDVAVAGSEKVLLDLPTLQPNTSGHYGGALRFGPDGKLYVGVGDDIKSTDAQSLSTVNGKILRINSDGTIPDDNPFYNNPPPTTPMSVSGPVQAIWALGLRQPYSLDVRSDTSQMFVNEVGEDTWEEIDEVARRANYGWPTHEGSTASPDPSLQYYKDPVLAYGHSGDPASAVTGCSITGGAFYDPAKAGIPGKFPDTYQNRYFYTDFCSGWIRSFDPADPTKTDKPFASGIVNPVDLEVGDNGSLYYVARGSSSVPASVHEIKYTGS